MHDLKMHDLFDWSDLFITVRDKELRAFNRVIFAEGHLAGIREAKKQYVSLIAEMDADDAREMERMKQRLIDEARSSGSIKETRLRVSKRTNDGGETDGPTPIYARFSVVDEHRVWRHLRRSERQPAWSAA